MQTELIESFWKLRFKGAIDLKFLELPIIYTGVNNLKNLRLFGQPQPGEVEPVSGSFSRVELFGGEKFNEIPTFKTGQRYGTKVKEDKFQVFSIEFL